jgi:ribosomal protein S18 acetylase RimI-like enzyme
MVDHDGAAFVRDATAADASVVAELQSRCWKHDYKWPDEVFEAIAASDPEMQWARAVIAPPGPGYRLLVATKGPEVVGFAALAPAQDADSRSDELEIVAWEVHPDHRGHGHGSRLLAALADHARSISAGALTTWIGHDDEARRFVLHEAGFAPDGAHRTVQMDEGWGLGELTLRQVRLGASV